MSALRCSLSWATPRTRVKLIRQSTSSPTANVIVDFTPPSSQGCRVVSPMSPSHPMMPSTAPEAKMLTVAEASRSSPTTTSQPRSLATAASGAPGAGGTSNIRRVARRTPATQRHAV
ncbi:hypothetical protein ABH921_001811 [Kocuria sp. MT07]